MQFKRTHIIIAALVIAAGVAVAIWLVVRPSYDDIVKGCQKELDSSSTKAHRPDACKDVSQKDYETLLMGWTMKHALDDMPKKDRDILDYYDDGSINGSLD
ncbi:hypothetical protein [Streptomyces sp. NPDC017964]|uniref:hypothetical protein n=1 Tax=Streptomyces sp. NPDC017964 TaxID=3365022 RepID=UPI0037A012A7